MESQLSPEHKDLQNEFVESLSEGGLSAATMMVNRLAIETAMLEAYHNHFVQMEYVNEDLMKSFPGKNLKQYIDIIDFVESVKADYKKAMTRSIAPMDERWITMGSCFLLFSSI